MQVANLLWSYAKLNFPPRAEALAALEAAAARTATGLKPMELANARRRALLLDARRGAAFLVRV